MAEEDGTTEGGEGNPATHRKKDANRQKIIIGVAIVGVVLTFLLLRRNASSNSQNTNTGNTAIDPNTGIPYAMESGYGYNPGLGTTDVGSQLYGIEAALASIQSSLGNANNQTPTNPSGSGSSNATNNPSTSGSWVPSNLPSNLMASMQNNGEWITSIAEGIGGDTLYLTNKGGVYDIGPGGGKGTDFFGSIFSLPANTQQGTRGTFNSLTPIAGGGYTIGDSSGQQYTFK